MLLVNIFSISTHPEEDFPESQAPNAAITRFTCYLMSKYDVQMLEINTFMLFLAAPRR